MVKDKLVMIGFVLLVVTSFVMTYLNFVVKKDFIISMDVKCDPLTENCFVRDCNLIEDRFKERCYEIYGDEREYFKILKRKYYIAMSCEAKPESACQSICMPNEEKCKEIKCESERQEECISEIKL